MPPELREPKICGDCGVQPGQPHEDGCDVARCMWDGGQAIQCEGLFAEHVRVLAEAGREDLAKELEYHLSIDDRDHDCGQDIWSGLWPGIVECRELDLWCYWGPDFGEETGWVRCDSEHPGASEDLNRLNGWGGFVWSREQRKWTRP